MRLRNTVAAVCGALALTAVLATPAQAATLHDPASDECITIAEAADPSASEPAFAPHNDTDALAVVFTEPDCTGDSWTLRPHGRPATDRLKLRSVVFLDG